MIDFHPETLLPACAVFGLVPDETALTRFNRYGNLLLERNRTVNLTAITDPKEVLYKHFYDCLLLLKQISPKTGARVADVGTGAGFPGLVLKIARPDLRVTLLDSLNKRLVFLNEVIDDLGLSGVETLHIRAEDAGRSALREQFDLVCARAVAGLPVLAEYCLPLTRRGGMFVAMKGPSAGQELAAAGHALALLGGDAGELRRETLTGQEERTFVLVKKISQTPTKYPRKPNEIAKQPL